MKKSELKQIIKEVIKENNDYRGNVPGNIEHYENWIEDHEFDEYFKNQYWDKYTKQYGLNNQKPKWWQHKKFDKGLNEQFIDYASRYVKDYVMKSFGISYDDIQKVKKIYNEVANRVGDSGSCVLGNELTIRTQGKSHVIMSSYAQGNLGLEEIQRKVLDYLEPKYPNIKFVYEWGNMD